MQNFINLANHFGVNKIPFFFIINFAKDDYQIIPIDLIDNYPIQFKINHQPPKYKKFDFKVIDNNFIAYQKSFNQIQHHIYQGDSYLINLTSENLIKTNLGLEEIFYYANAKYKVYFKDRFVCFSPECFIKIIDNNIYTYPMKGTIKGDLSMKNQLIAKQKEQDEHCTIVDLLRNDLNMVATNVQVKKFRFIEQIDTNQGSILQSSSEIVGNLANDWRANIGHILDLLLPAGSITGAPKAKTVEIINQAENYNRGFYTGVFGVFDGQNLDSAVLIRFIEKKGDNFYFKSGGGITFQSKLEEEYQEMINKIYVPITVI